MTELARPLETGWLPVARARRGPVRRAPGPAAVPFTSDYSRPGFVRAGLLPITRFTLWAVAA